MREFKKFEINESKLCKIITGGISACKAAAPYSCTATGYTVGTVGFHNCMVDIYAGCEALAQN